MEDTLKSIQRKAKRQSRNPKNLGYFQNFNCGNAEVNNAFFNAGTGPSCTGSMGEDLDIEEKEMAEKTKLHEADEDVEIKLNSDELNNPDSFSLKDTVKNRLDRVKQEKEDAEKQAEITAFEAKYGPIYDAFMDSYGKRESIETVLDTMEDLVPDSGKADTVAGEIVRAINRIGYRYLNDGDEFYYGEGLDTVAPSVAYLCHKFNITSDIEEIAECELEEDAYYSSMCDIFWKILKELADHREYFFTKNIEDSRDYDASAIKKLEPLVDQEYYISEEIRQYVEAGKIGDNDIVERVEDVLYDLQRQVDSDMSVSIYGYNVQINNVPKSIVEEVDRIFDYDEFWESYYEDLIDDYGDLDEVEEEYDDDPDYDFEDEEEDMDESLKDIKGKREELTETIADRIASRQRIKKRFGEPDQISRDEKREIIKSNGAFRRARVSGYSAFRSAIKAFKTKKETGSERTLFNIYVDDSGSMLVSNKKKLENLGRNVASLLTGKNITVRIYYFADKVATTRGATATGCGGSDLECIVQHLQRGDTSDFVLDAEEAGEKCSVNAVILTDTNTLGDNRESDASPELESVWVIYAPEDYRGKITVAQDIQRCFKGADIHVFECESLREGLDPDCPYRSMYEGLDDDDPEIPVSDYDNIKSIYDFDDQEDNVDDYFDSDWEVVRTKTVYDADGFTTDYTLYQKDGKYACIFGDRDLYSPDDTEADAEFEDYREALEWFDSYSGFEDEDEDFDECIHSNIAMHYSNEGKNPYDDDYCEDDSLDEGAMKELAYDAESDEKYVEKLQRSIKGLEEELDFLTNQAPKEVRRGGAFDSQEEIEDAKKATQRELNMEKAKLAILTRGD